MELEFLGHACVVLRSGGQSLLIDPYESGQFGGQMGYRPIDVVSDWVVCSHDHVDHAAVHAVPGSPTLVDAGTVGPFRVRRVPLHHDEYEGRRRGGRVDALRIDTDAGSLLHLSDVGEAPRRAVVDAHRGVDILLVPTGGLYTIGAAQAWEWIERIAPRVAIPIHYATPACTLPIRDVRTFSGWWGGATVWNSHRFHVQEIAPKCVIVAPRLV